MEELAALERVKGGRENEKGGMESEAIDRSVLFSFRAGYSISTTFLSSNGHRVSSTFAFFHMRFFFFPFFNISRIYFERRIFYFGRGRRGKKFLGERENCKV